ncbi:MAG: hypothetical protein NZ555_00785 [Geminicoccaceae bacterium]|nr:hypothetical protein [Geminicoccaceae bacterium]MDW8369157.1 hypothetical protein [Geminicoccaceae bacterium]
MNPLPALVAHADWSASAAARAVVLAERAGGDAGWRLKLGAPGLVPELLASPHALVGFDAPLGLPQAYAEARGIASFRGFLATLDPEDPFWTPVRPPERPSLARPFYPARPGGARRAYLEAGLGLGPFATHLRRCDRLTNAQCLFWTLGPKQCGRAALAIWRELLLGPREELAIWPFDGPLERLLAEPRPIVAETYPGLAYRLLGLPRFAKSRAADRARLAAFLSQRAEALDARLDPSLEAELRAGFPNYRDHGFDALVGCLLLLEIVRGLRPAGDPVPAEVLSVEGWMLGLAPVPSRTVAAPPDAGDRPHRRGTARSGPRAARPPG